MADGFERIEAKFDAKFEYLANKLFETGNFLAHKIELIEQSNAEFRDQMLTIMDSVTKQYDEFRTEKTAIAAGQDRMQQEINLLKESDDRQNNSLHELNTRITRLEAA